MTDAKHEAPAEDDDGPCTCCDDTGITIQTERPCACAAGIPFEAPAEGAGETLMLAGNPFGTGLSEPRLVRARSSAPEAREGDQAVAGVKALAFFKWARDFFWCEDGCEIDGGDFQDAAERFGLIVKVPFDPERHADNGYGLEAGDDWYETEPAVELALSTPDALKGNAKP